MNDDKNESIDNTVILDLGNYGAAQPTYSISGLGDTIDISGISTITLPSTSYTGAGSTIGYNGSATTYSWSSGYNSDPAVNITTDGITMKPGSDIKVGDKSLLEAISAIEERLAILKPNPALEDRWDQLKELRQKYIDLEKELLEKEKMWEILKKD
jgi:hypothetical protein